MEADFKSRWLEPHTEIELSDSRFKNLCERFRKPEIDLFASRKNAKCPTFVSWKKDPESIAIDAFTLPWNQLFFYALPPSSVILRALQKIKSYNARGIMIVPEWPAQPWYPLSHDLLNSEAVIVDCVPRAAWWRL